MFYFLKEVVSCVLWLLLVLTSMIATAATLAAYSAPAIALPSVPALLLPLLRLLQQQRLIRNIASAWLLRLVQVLPVISA
jgi:hypothetical protein